MESFRVDLIHFLAEHQLPVDPIRAAAPWLTFLRKYLDVISDFPIRSRQAGFNHVDAVLLSVPHDPPTELRDVVAFAYTLRWTFLKGNQEVFTWANEVCRAGAS